MPSGRGQQKVIIRTWSECPVQIVRTQLDNCLINLIIDFEGPLAVDWTGAAEEPERSRSPISIFFVESRVVLMCSQSARGCFHFKEQGQGD